VRVGIHVTPSERKALLFFAAVLSLGAGTRFVASLRMERAGRGAAADPAALQAQLHVVDSLRNQPRGSRRPRGAAAQRSRRPVPQPADTPLLVNVDYATAQELEALPRIGPTLARRIVQDRDEHGPFRSLDAMQRVKGIGPKLVTHIAPHVTFSSPRRPTTVRSVSAEHMSRTGRSPPPD
jgi:competence ComEA-like helix-hairpin-helix protein